MRRGTKAVHLFNFLFAVLKKAHRLSQAIHAIPNDRGGGGHEQLTLTQSYGNW